MRAVSALVFLFATLLCATAQNSLKNLEKVRIYGSDYVRLKEWCNMTSFGTFWVKKDEELRLTNRWWRFSFTVDSRRAQVNGINLMLSLPVVLRNGAPLVSFVDLQTAIRPIAFLSKSSTPIRIKTICLDPGHGGKDPGNMEKKSQEKKYTLLLAEEVAKILRQAEFKVVLTRSKDQFIELSDRAAVANRNGADLFISLHYNSAGSSEVSGVETYCMSPAGTASSNTGGGKIDPGTFSGNAHNEKNMLLAYQMQKSLLKNLAAEDRGIKRARFEVLREVKMPAVMIEGGFMSNPGDAKKIYDSVYRKKMAQAIVDGMLAYQKIVEQ